MKRYYQAPELIQETYSSPAIMVALNSDVDIDMGDDEDE